MTSFRFFHAADIHLDSPLLGLAGQDGEAAQQIRIATRAALDTLVETAINEDVDFMVLAGDVYDGDWRDYKTGLFFVKQMARLNEAAIPVYLLHGNHDAASHMTRRLELPKNVHVFSASKPQTFMLKDSEFVALHGQSYKQRAVMENLVIGYPDPIPGAFNIGVLHTGLGGMGNHANYAPCTRDDLLNKGYDYWALGHVHHAQVIHELPWIVFPGNLQGRHAREIGPKGAQLVSIVDNELADLSFVPCDVVRWITVSVSLENIQSFGEVTSQIELALAEAISDETEGRLLACRILLEGRTPAHNQLVTSEEHLLAESRALALGFGEDVVWIEKVVLNTAPTIDLITLMQRGDAVGELLRYLRTAVDDEVLVGQLNRSMGELARKLPPEFPKPEDKPLLAAINNDYAELIERVMPFLTAHLTIKEQ